SNYYELAARVNTEPQASIMSNIPTPTPEASPQGESSIAGEASVPGRQSQSPVPVPTPVVGPSLSELTVPVAPSTGSTKLNPYPFNGTIPFDFPKRQETADAEQRAQGSRQDANAAVMESAGNAQKTAPAGLVEPVQGRTRGSAVQSKNEIAARITPPSDINPMNSDQPSPAPTGKPQPEKEQYGRNRLTREAEIKKKSNITFLWSETE